MVVHWLRPFTSNAGAWVGSLVWEKRPHMPCADWSKKKKKKNNIEHINIHIIGVPDDVFDEIIVKSFQNLKKETDIQMQEAEGLSNKMNPNRPIPRHIII